MCQYLFRLINNLFRRLHPYIKEFHTSNPLRTNLKMADGGEILTVCTKKILKFLASGFSSFDLKYRMQSILIQVSAMKDHILSMCSLAEHPTAFLYRIHISIFFPHICFNGLVHVVKCMPIDDLNSIFFLFRFIFCCW